MEKGIRLGSSKACYLLAFDPSLVTLLPEGLVISGTRGEGSFSAVESGDGGAEELLLLLTAVLHLDVLAALAFVVIEEVKHIEICLDFTLTFYPSVIDPSRLGQRVTQLFSAGLLVLCLLLGVIGIV